MSTTATLEKDTNVDFDGSPSLIEAAEMAADSYSKLGSDNLNWRADRKLGNHGFAAVAFSKKRMGNAVRRQSVKKPSRVIAFRGTDDQDDAIEDLFMSPTLDPKTVDKALTKLMKMYRMNSPAPQLLVDWLRELQRNGVVPNQAFKSVPPLQTRQALAFFDSENKKMKVDYVVGHSLGGALAKIVALRRGVNCIAFNAPYIGGLQGSLPTNIGGEIYNVNAKLDPVSRITRFLGASTVGNELTINTPAPRTYQPSQTGIFAGAMSYAINRRYGNSVNDILILGHLAAHYHSIDTLKKAIKRGSVRFSLPLGNMDVLSSKRTK